MVPAAAEENLRVATRSPPLHTESAVGDGTHQTEAATTYRAVMLSRHGGPEALEVIELPRQAPGAGQIRVRVLAAGVGSTDLTMLAGKYLYAPKLPFVPGYEVAGVIDAIGPGVTMFDVGQRVAALTVHGGYGEYLVREAEHFLPIPDEVTDLEAAAVVLNYVTAWQMIHRTAKVRSGQTALVTGAAGGVGTAALELLRLAGVKAYGAASKPKHGTVEALGATPVDYRAGPIDVLMKTLEPQGVDYVFDAVGGSNIGPCIGALRLGGMIVGYGFMDAPGKLGILGTFLNLFIGSRLRGRRGAFYGITMSYRKRPELLREDLPKIFALLAKKSIRPLVSVTLPLLDAQRALQLLASGSLAGKIVLTNSREESCQADPRGSPLRMTE
jgi:NADPH:quinone reductase-like Zn-dependent oxidoreductase